MGPRRNTHSCIEKKKITMGHFFIFYFGMIFVCFTPLLSNAEADGRHFTFLFVLSFFLFFNLFVYLLPLVCLRSDTLFCYINLTLHATLLDLTTLWR